MRKKGFTVAEILIAIAVAGLLASVVIPVFNNVRPNRELIMLRKAYYMATRTINELINDDDFYPDTENENTSGFSNTAPAIYHGQSYRGDGKFCGLFAARMNLRDSANCAQAVPEFVRGQDPVGNFETTDGIVWRMPIGNFSNEAEAIDVDLNGSREPNCFGSDGECEHPDRFRINVNSWGTVFIDAKTRALLTTDSLTGSYEEIN